MKAKVVIPRAQANRDVDEAIARYLKQDTMRGALGFIDAIEAAYKRIGQHPGTGSPRFAHELNLPGLRALPLTRYPYLVFYVERTDRIDVWRVLHGERNVAVWLRGPENI